MQHNSQLEARLVSLERDLKRQKLVTLALFVGAIVAVSATRVVSQGSAPREMTLRTLNIVGADGRLRAVLSGDAALNKDGGSLALVDDKGTVRLGLMATQKGGSLSILDSQARPTAMIGSDNDQGMISLSSGQSKARVNVAVTKDVSGIVVIGTNGREHFVAGADANGGMAQLYDFNGQLKKQLP